MMVTVPEFCVLASRGFSQMIQWRNFRISVNDLIHLILDKTAAHSAESSQSQVHQHIMKLTRLRVVDNSAIGKQAMLEGKPPRCIHVYKKTGIGTIGDKVLVAIKGLKKKALIVGVKQKQKALIPRFDSNNIVLLDDHGNPLGTRILVPIPSVLRGRGEFSKVIALCSRFV